MNTVNPTRLRKINADRPNKLAFAFAARNLFTKVQDLNSRVRDYPIAFATKGFDPFNPIFLHNRGPTIKFVMKGDFIICFHG